MCVHRKPQIHIPMKKTVLLLLLVVGLVGTIALVNSSNPNVSKDGDSYADVHQAMQDEIALDKLTGAEKFVAYHDLIKSPPEGYTGSYTSGYIAEEYKHAKKRAISGSPAQSRQTVEWVERGPGNVSGRCRTIWVDPSDSSGKTWFVGSAQGGVWKTSDAGETYALKSPDVPHLGTAAIMGCTSSPNVIYAGSGEGFNSLSPAGAGVFKSVDGGETWDVLVSTVANQSFANIFRIAVSHDDPDVVYVATKNDNTLEETEGFVMRSKDGGETWDEVLFHFDAVSHIVMHPTDPNILFAGLNQEGLLRTTDGGDNWDFVYMYENAQLRPDRIEIAISPSDPNFIYFTTQIQFEDRIFVSRDGGDTFQDIIPNDPIADDYSQFSGGQSFWNKAIAVHPFDPLQFYFAGQSAMLKITLEDIPDLAVGYLSVISDGYGAYFEVDDVGTKGVHVDHHGITFSVTDPDTEEFILINTNDGGVAVSHDNGATFTQTGDTFLQGFNPESGTWTTIPGLNASTFYGVDKMNGADRYVGGTQDNGSWISATDPDETSTWSYAPSGDGFEAAWNYDDANKVIESSQGNNFSRTLDGGATWEAMPTPGRGPFITAIANSKQDADMVVISTNQGPAVSYDFGSTWTTGVVPEQYRFSGLRTPVDISLVEPSIVWTGTGIVGESLICLSRDGGYTYEATNDYIDAPMGEVAGIATHPADEGTAYALFGAAQLPKIVRTTDYGQSWEDISGFVDSTVSDRGFPDVAVYSLLVMPYDNDIIWAGTEIGIVESLDGGLSWNLVDDTLPATSIWEMKIINDEVVVATHGRGIFTATLPELEGYEPPAVDFLSSILRGDLFDKQLAGGIEHRTAVDSGEVVLKFIGNGQEETRTIDIDEYEAMEVQGLDEDYDDIPSEDLIWDAVIETTVYQDGQSRFSRYQGLFYDVDADDPVSMYSNDFDDERSDLAIGLNIDGVDFEKVTPDGFSSAAMFASGSADDQTEYRAILQKPITIENGTRISFDEIVLSRAGFEQGPGQYFYFQSILLEATNDEGKTWVTIDEYSSERDPVWQSASDSNQPITEDMFRNRIVQLDQYFELGDEVYFKWAFNDIGFGPPGRGYIIDNVQVSTVVSNDNIAATASQVTVKNNPFASSTTIEVMTEESQAIRGATLTDMSGNKVKANIVQSQISGGVSFNIQGDRLASGTYLFHAIVDGQQVVQRLIKI